MLTSQFQKNKKKIKIANKLHVKFELQGSEKSWKLAEKQYSGQSELFNAVHSEERNCDICLKCKKLFF